MSSLEYVNVTALLCDFLANKHTIPQDKGAWLIVIGNTFLRKSQKEKRYKKSKEKSKGALVFY